MNKAIAWPLAHNRIRRGLRNHTFGMVRHNPDGSRRPHQGWDFAAANGTPCFAVADGVIEAVRDGGPYGLQIMLRFSFDFDGDGQPDTLFAHYAHLSRIEVRVGQKVVKGEPIGLTGSSGNAAGMKPVDQHLHFEVREAAILGPGLDGRFTPLVIFGLCPLEKAIVE